LSCQYPLASSEISAAVMVRVAEAEADIVNDGDDGVRKKRAVEGARGDIYGKAALGRQLFGKSVVNSQCLPWWAEDLDIGECLLIPHNRSRHCLTGRHTNIKSILAVPVAVTVLTPGRPP
jgi:hypothetical protein